ncbi:hypothetical protein [Nonomuraea sp. NPDC050786]|uniref:hypothetical protein n=1 Tax=Nonomuraea sp. NPDC050786 TaxID=3154840 RepID=UPI0033FBE209
MSNFEERLLSALKEEITTRKSENATATTTVTPVERPSRRRLVGLSTAAAGVAVATTAMVVLTGLDSTPAYAVTKGADGAVDVRINEFSDPEGLAGELATAGVKAVVDYLPEGRTCKEPRGERGSGTGRFAASVGRSSGGISFKIEEGQVPAGETLVLAVSKSKDGDDRPPFAMSLTVVKGPVAPCEPITMPAPGTGAEEDGGPGLVTKTEGPNQGSSFNTESE